MVALACTQFQARAIKTASTELQLALVREIARHAEQDQDQARRDLLALSNALTQADWGEEAQISVTKALLESMPRLDQLDIYDARGQFIDRVRLSADPAQGPGSGSRKDQGSDRGSGARPSPLPRLSPTMQSQAVQKGQWLSTPERNQALGIRQTWVLPLRAQGELTGFIASPVRLAPLSQHLRSLAQIQLAGTEHALYISDLEGRVLASSNPVHEMSDAGQDPLFDALTLEELPPDTGVAKELSASPGSGPSEYAALATVLRMSARPWLVVAKVPTQAAFAPLYELRQHLLRSVLAVFAGALAVAFLLARRVSLPLSALLSMAQRLQRGRFDHTALLQRNDELGEVARAMNHAVKDLHLRGNIGSKDTREDLLSDGHTPRGTPADFDN